MPKLQGFLDGFQTQLTAQCLSTDLVASFATSGMVPGLRYQFRIDDTNPPTTFEYVECEYQDPATAAFVNGGAGRGVGGTGPATHPIGAWVTGILLRESLLPTFARSDTENLMAFASASGIAGQHFDVYGLAGAQQPTRYVGATTGGAPTTGAFLAGDFVLDTANGVIWICTLAGSPGTWQNILYGTNTGLTGAVSSLTRWIGATGDGPPLAGTWNQGDVSTARSGAIWVCILGGTPGTWIPSGVPSRFRTRVVNNANQGGIATNTATKVVFQTKDFDPNSNFDNVTNNRYTVPITGYYEVCALINWSPGGQQGRAFVMIYKNGAEVVGSRVSGYVSTNGVIFGQSTSLLLLLTAGDYLEVWCQHLFGAGAQVLGSGNDNCSFSVNYEGS